MCGVSLGPTMPRGLAFLLLALVVVGLAACEARQSAIDLDGDTHLNHVAFDGRSLWMVTNTGRLWTLTADKGARPERVETPEPVVELCVDGERVMVVTAGPDTGAPMTLRTRDPGDVWRALARWDDVGDGLAALVCDGGLVTALTGERMLRVEAGALRSIPLAEPLPDQRASAALMIGDTILIGFNIGEFGGGLNVVDRRTGAGGVLGSRDVGEPCGGGLDADCDAIWGLAPSPWKSGCVVAAIGNLHMIATGRLAELCGDRTRELHVGRCPQFDPEAWFGGSSRGKGFCSEPFYSVVATRDAIVAVGSDGVTRIDRQGRVERNDFGRLPSRGPFRVRFDDDIILIDAELAGRTSPFDSTMMVLPRHPPPPAPPPATPSPL